MFVKYADMYMKIGGEAKKFIEIENKKELSEVLKELSDMIKKIDYISDYEKWNKINEFKDMLVQHLKAHLYNCKNALTAEDEDEDEDEDDNKSLWCDED